MRLKDLFTVPTGEKVTEKHLNRVLASSICGLLLCMACLVGTTWAWFADSIVNEGNVIQIGTPQVVLQVNGADVEDGGKLQAGTHTITVAHANQADSLAKKSNLFVTFTISKTLGNEAKIVSQYIMLNEANGYAAQISLQLDGEYAFSWNTTWATPAGVNPAAEQTIVVTADQPADDPVGDPVGGEQPGADEPPAQQPGGDPPVTTQPTEPAEGENNTPSDTGNGDQPGTGTEGETEIKTETETNGETGTGTDTEGEHNGETGGNDETTTNQETT